jgi:hypothetical protein
MPSGSYFDLFPPELVFMVLENLTYHDETAFSSLTLYHFASTSRSFFQILTEWSSYIARFDIAKIEHLRSQGILPLLENYYSPLSILCRRLAGRCAFCQERQTRNELFSNLQTCDGCDEYYFPKISHTRVLSLYCVSKFCITEDPLITVDRRWIVGRGCHAYKGLGNTGRDAQIYGPFYLWKDIEQFAENTELVLNQTPKSDMPESKYYSEELSYLETPTKFEHHYGIWQGILIWLAACSRWDPLFCPHRYARLNPITVEIIFLREFRYKFDPNWRPRGTEDEEYSEYFQIARHWKDAQNWVQRPWAAHNFLFPPKLLNNDPHATPLEKAIALREFRDYQLRCRKLRAVLVAFPDILRDPSTFVWCFKRLSLSLPTVISFAVSGRRRWIEPTKRELIVQLVKCHRCFYVELNMSLSGAVSSHLCFRTHGTKKDIVVLKGTQVKIYHRS